MRSVAIMTVNAACLVFLAAPAKSQTSQIGKKWEFRSRAEQLAPFVDRVERKDVRAPPFAGLSYLQRLEDRIAAEASVKADEVRLTLGSEWYTFLLPQGVVEISGGLILRMANEAELAGLIAHQLGHVSRKNAAGRARFQQCVLALGTLPVAMGEVSREAERQATRTAIGYLKEARYDPSKLLDVLSKLSYEKPIWGKAIVPEDLLSLRVVVEAQAEPQEGYVVDSTDFAKLRRDLVSAGIIEHAPRGQ